MAISTNGTVIARLAGGLYNTVISNATYLEVAAQDPSTLANTLYARDFAKSTDAAVAKTLVANLGLSSVAGLDNWVAAQLTAAGAANKGAKIVSLLNDFAGMTADTTYGAYATAFNTKVDAALASSQKTGAVEGKFAEAVASNATFTLTSGVDTFVGTAGNDTFNATGKTLTNLDSLTGGAGTDTLAIVDADASMGNAGPTGATLTGVEKITVSSAGTVGVVASSGTTAVQQVNTITPVVPGAITDTYTVNYAGVSQATAAVGATTILAAATKIKDTINALAGTTVAAVGGTTGAETVVITAPTAGTPLPSVSASNSSVVLTTANVVGTASTSAAQYDFSGFTDTTDLSISSIGGLNVAAAATTNLTATNTGGGAVVSGGLAQNVTNTSGAVTSSGAAGAVVIGVTSQGSGVISVDGGTNVTITTATTTGNTYVGSNNAQALGSSSTGVKPTGVVTVNQKVSGSSTSNRTGGAVETKGGSSVVITETASQPSPSVTNTTFKTLTTSATGVYGSAVTTDVTVNKAAAVTGSNYAAAVAKSSESVSVQFKALAAGATVTVEGLTFTAGTSGATAAQVASAFANLAKGASAGVIAKTIGTFSGSLATATDATDNFTSGAANGDTVTFTSATATSNGLVVTTSGTAPVATEVSAYAAGSAATGKGAVAASGVTVTDINYSSGTGTKAGTIKSVTVANATTVSINDSALSSLTVTGGTGNIIIDNSSALLPEAKTTTLALSIGGQKGGTLDDADIYKALNVTTTSASYLSNITFGATTALTVAGTAGLGLDSAAGLSAVKTITVSGSAGLSDYTSSTYNSDGTTKYTTTTLDLSGLSTLTSVDASATSGAIKATILATQTSYAGGSGADAVTTSAGTISKSIATGAGNDTVTITGSSATISNSIDGGEGTDTLAMTAAAAAAVPAGGAVFKSYVTNFETLKTTDDVAADTTITVSDLGLASSVNVGGVVASTKTLTLDKFADAGTLTISKTGQAGTIALTNATAWATSTADTAASYAANTVNVTLTGTTADAYDSSGVVTGTTYGNITGGTVSLSKVGTVNITATDAGSSSTGLVASDTLTLTNAKAYAVNVSGNANLTLTLTSGTAPKTIDGSALTGALTVTANAVTGGATVTGGAGKDVLTASSGTAADKLIGGAGNDTLTANTGADTLTGGTGSDKFVVTAVTAAKTIYTTITDFGAGDSLKLLDTAGTETFVSTAVNLSALTSSASLGDAINTAIRGTAQGQINWFQFGGDTYVTVAADVHSSTGDFVDGADQVVKLTGLVDLSGVGFNAGAQLLQA